MRFGIFCRSSEFLQEKLNLTLPSHPKTDEIALTCLDFPGNESSAFWVGTMEGSVYQANRYDRAGMQVSYDARIGINC
jgi:dynein intermediate chain